MCRRFDPGSAHYFPAKAASTAAFVALGSRCAAIILQTTRTPPFGSVRKAYPSADGLKLKSGTIVTVFNTKGGRDRLLAVIDYASHFIEALKVPTHAEDNKNLCKERVLMAAKAKPRGSVDL